MPDKVDRPSGEIIVLGTGLTLGRGFSQPDTFALARLSSGGGVRRFFASDLKFAPGLASEPFAMTIDTSGRIVVVGKSSTTFGAPGDFAVARLTPTLAFDPTFDEDGRRVVDLGMSEHATSVQVVDTNILAFGMQETNSDAKLIAMRFRDDGTRNGTRTIQFPGIRSDVSLMWSSAWNEASDVFLMADVFADQHQSVLVARFSTSTLALVPTFGGGGFVTTNLGSGATFGGGIAVAALSQEPVVVGND